MREFSAKDRRKNREYEQMGRNGSEKRRRIVKGKRFCPESFRGPIAKGPRTGYTIYPWFSIG
jgi:hypothetical protein